MCIRDRLEPKASGVAPTPNRGKRGLPAEPKASADISSSSSALVGGSWSIGRAEPKASARTMGVGGAESRGVAAAAMRG
eukprot:6118111-Prorocentrum_lima.AAC.1